MFPTLNGATPILHCGVLWWWTTSNCKAQVERPLEWLGRASLFFPYSVHMSLCIWYFDTTAKWENLLYELICEPAMLTCTFIRIRGKMGGCDYSNPENLQVFTCFPNIILLGRPVELWGNLKSWHLPNVTTRAIPGGYITRRLSRSSILKYLGELLHSAKSRKPPWELH